MKREIFERSAEYCRPELVFVNWKCYVDLLVLESSIRVTECHIMPARIKKSAKFTP